MTDFRVSPNGDLCGVVYLNAWRGGRDPSGPYASLSDQASDGLVEVVLLRSGASGELAGGPSDRELEAVKFLQENEQIIADVLIATVLEAYPSIRGWLQDCVSEDELAAIAPPADDGKGFRRLIGLGSVFVLPSEFDGAPYFGFELGCSWDVEHGLGAVFRGVEIIEIGSADIAIDGSLPRADQILRNLMTLLENSGIDPNLRLSRRQALWKHMPWVDGPTPELGLYDERGRLLVAADVTDFHWEGQSRWWIHFIQYRNEPQSFARMTICPTRAEVWVWKKQSSDEKDWAPILEATGLDAVISLDENEISVPMGPLYSGIDHFGVGEKRQYNE